MQFAPDLQLEEYYLSAQGQGRPHISPLIHTASYPPASAQGQYRAFNNHISQGSAGQQPTRSRSLGQNADVYGSSASGVYEPSMSQAQTAGYNTNSNVNGFYTTPPLPSRQYQPDMQVLTSPDLSAGGLSDPLSVNGTSDGGLSPPFVASPMSAPMGFGDPSQGQSQGQSQYHTQQIFHFHPNTASGSNTSPGNVAHGHQPAGKRPRRLEDDDEYGPDANVGMEHEHEDSTGQDNKDPKPKP